MKSRLALIFPYSDMGRELITAAAAFHAGLLPIIARTSLQVILQAAPNIDGEVYIARSLKEIPAIVYHASDPPPENDTLMRVARQTGHDIYKVDGDGVLTKLIYEDEES